MCKGRAGICLSVLLQPKLDRRMSGSQLGPREGKSHCLVLLMGGSRSLCLSVLAFVNCLVTIPEHPVYQAPVRGRPGPCLSILADELNIHQHQESQKDAVHSNNNFSCTYVLSSDTTPVLLSTTSLWPALGRPLILTGRICSITPT